MNDDYRTNYNHPYRPEDNQRGRSGQPGQPGQPIYNAGGRNGKQYRKGDAPFQFPWWAILIGFITWWPLGFIFLGLNSAMEKGHLKQFSNDMNGIGNSAQGQNPAPRVHTTPAGQAPIYAQNAPATAKKAPTKKSAAKKDGPDALTILTIAGGILAAIGLLSMPDALGSLLTATTLGGTYLSSVLGDLVSSLGFLAGGAGCLFAAGRMRIAKRLRKKVDNIVGHANSMYIEDIAGAVPCTYEKCCKVLEDCIDAGLFGDEAYLDMRTRCLVVKGQAPAARTADPAPAPAKKDETKASSDKYQQILDDLHRVNEAIPDQVMTDKIARLESVSAKIFAQAKADPDKLPRMRKFMDYYLPTSLKLLKTYAELDSQGVEGENIRESKRRIEQTMDTLVVAFENQLDQLFSNDALDVSADIDVMQNMMRADGLTGTDPFKVDPFKADPKTAQAPVAPETPHLEL